MAVWRREEPFVFRYATTGTETFFLNRVDPDARSREVFAFHRPETLAAWMRHADEHQDAPDYPLLGIPIYVIFDPRTGSGAVFTDIHSTPEGPRYAVRKNFVYGEDVTIGEWTIPTSGLPRYQDDGAEEAESRGA